MRLKDVPLFSYCATVEMVDGETRRTYYHRLEGDGRLKGFVKVARLGFQQHDKDGNLKHDVSQIYITDPGEAHGLTMVVEVDPPW